MWFLVNIVCKSYPVPEHKTGHSLVNTIQHKIIDTELKLLAEFLALL